MHSAPICTSGHPQHKKIGHEKILDNADQLQLSQETAPVTCWSSLQMPALQEIAVYEIQMAVDLQWLTVWS